MSTRVIKGAVVFLVIFAAAQLVRPGRANLPIDASRTIQAHLGTDTGLITVLDRACNDCHSNRAAWPRFTQIAPLSWVTAAAESEGRHAINFSEWAAYSPEEQRTLLAASCEDVSEGRMPGWPYTLIRPDARLSAHDIEIICAAAQHIDEAAAHR